MWNFLTEIKNTKRYIDIVDKFVYSDNNTWHRSIQMTPASVNETNHSLVGGNLYVDFIYPHTWYNIREDNNLFGFDLGDGKSIARRIPQGCYESIPDNLDGMYLEDCFSQLLGFEPGEIKGKLESPYIADPNASFPLIYVYCDLAEPRIGGDVLAKLLKIVKFEGKDGEVVNAQYTRLHYVPVIRRHLQTVEMALILHSGDLVPFERGRVIAMLHKMRQIE
ncbi:uncharacterized protein TNIN_178011 [Trichonephila inaurata madagascariensis]|uniref:Uncharacterized protein n=1 Tax=Trichonephila inaurata madagascariensis TaxID=2747483 RepID=A0A8X6WTD8_9ARAC|nr:uncharacterized protein TNIN_178011 [Trichonephila inaurata madagascariensis]